MKRLLVYILIPVLAILLMSHNTSALNNQLLGDNWYLYRQTSGNPFCAQNSSDPETRRSSEYSPWNLNLHERAWWSCVDSDSPRSTINAARGDIIVVELNTDYELSPYWYNSSARYLFSSYSRNIQTIYYATDGFNNSVEFGWTYNSEMNGVSNTLFRIQSINIYKPKGQTDYTQALNDIKNNLPSASDIGNAVNAPDEQAANDIQNQSASDIGNTTNAETQSLLNAFGSFVSAIASISPSNCNVDFDLGHIDFGEQNLCSVSVPTVFTTITSIIVIMFTIPFVYHLVNRILGLIREMQT